MQPRYFWRLVLAVAALLLLSCSDEPTDDREPPRQDEQVAPQVAASQPAPPQANAEDRQQASKSAPLYVSPTAEEIEAEIRADPRRAFSGCDQLLAYYQAVAWRAMESGQYFRSDRVGEERWFWEAPAIWAAAGVTSDTGTNLRVAGVDEADGIKTDGERIYLLTLDRLVVLTTQAHEPPSVIAELELSQRDYWHDDGPRPVGARGNILLAGDRALLVRYFGAGSLDEDLEPYGPITELVEVDLADPHRPQIVRTAEFGDSIPVRSRLVGRQARLVLHFLHQPPFSHSRDAQARGSNWSLTRIERTELADWHPFYRLTHANRPGETTELPVDCGATYLPTKLPFVPYRATEVPYVVDVDLGVGLAEMRTAVLLANAEMPHSDSWAYVTTDSAYTVTNTKYASAVHRIDFRTHESPKYSGSIEINNSIDYEQSLHEHDGTLRILAGGLPRTYRDAQIHTFELDDFQDKDGPDPLLGGFGRETGRLSLGEGYIVVRFVGNHAFVFRFPRGELGNLWVLSEFDYNGSLEQTASALEGVGYEWYLLPVEHASILAMNGQRGVGDAESVRPMLISDGITHWHDAVGIAGWDGFWRFRNVHWQDGVAWLVGTRELVGLRVTRDAVRVEARLTIDTAPPRYQINRRRVVIAGGQIHASWYDEGYKMYTWSMGDHEYLGVVDLGQSDW